MIHCLPLLALLLALPALAAEKAPLRALLITGGCCHDYATQKEILKKGLEARAHIVVDQVHSTDRSTRATFDIYNHSNWAEGYDVVIHDECSSSVKDMATIQNILDAHKTVPAVNLHCAMHSYRTGTDDWFRFVGIQSTGHGPQVPIEITFTRRDHPAVQSQKDWTTMREELYNSVKVFDTATPLATGRQVIRRRNGEDRVAEAVVVWANQYGDTRVFSTTLGHNNGTVEDPRYLDLVLQGLLWSCDKLGQGYKKK